MEDLNLFCFVFYPSESLFLVFTEYWPGKHAKLNPTGKCGNKKLKTETKEYFSYKTQELQILTVPKIGSKNIFK